MRSIYNNAYAAVKAIEVSQRKLKEAFYSTIPEVEELEMRLLELRGTEEQIAEARARQEKRNLLLQMEENKLQMQIARATGDKAALDEAVAKETSLRKQIQLLDTIHREEAAIREAERKEKAAEEKKRAEEEKKRADEEKKRAAEEKKRAADAEKKRIEDE
jgi:colicin import membrane protein